MPQYAGVALPLALFLGILIGLRRMSRDSELVTLEAAGVGLCGLAKMTCGPAGCGFRAEPAGTSKLDRINFIRETESAESFQKTCQ